MNKSNKSAEVFEMVQSTPPQQGTLQENGCWGLELSGTPSPLQFIVAEDGACGLIYEHAAAEGPPIVSLLDHVIEFT